MVFLAVSAFTLFLMPITLWTVSPSVGTEESEGLMVGDRRHREAVKALDQARREARDGGAQKREAIACVLSWGCVGLRADSLGFFRRADGG